MALSIGVREGSKIQVGKNLLSVKQIDDSRRIHILYGKQEHLITDEERTEVEPDVFISCGIKSDRPTNYNFSRLAFEAPRSVEIHRIREDDDQPARIR